MGEKERPQWNDAIATSTCDLSCFTARTIASISSGLAVMSLRRGFEVSPV